MEETLEKVRLFAAAAHGKQVRKYTGEPYINHPVRVMEICRGYTRKLPVLAAALLHDVLEDTPVTEEELDKFLHEVMDQSAADRTLKLVIALTDVYIKADYPHLNRKARKIKEAERMRKIEPDAQTVKYADIIDNAVDIVKNDKGFASKFLREVKDIMSGMDKGDQELYKRAEAIISSCFGELKSRKKADRDQEGI